MQSLIQGRKKEGIAETQYATLILGFVSSIKQVSERAMAAFIRT